MEDEELRAAAAVLRMGTGRLARRLRAERPVGVLSANKIGILALLNQHGPSTPGELAAADRQQPQSLTRIFAELERDGMVSRSRSPSDGRQSVLALTALGREILTADIAARDAWLVSAMSELTETECQVLRLAGALMDRLAAAD